MIGFGAVASGVLSAPPSRTSNCNELGWAATVSAAVNSIQSPSKETRVARAAHPMMHFGFIKATSGDEIARSRLASERILPP